MDQVDLAGQKWRLYWYINVMVISPVTGIDEHVSMSWMHQYWTEIGMMLVALVQFWFKEPAHKGFIKMWFRSWENKYWFYLNDNDQISLQFCPCHDSSAAMVWAKLWPDWIIRNISARRISTRFQSWAYKLFVKWVPVLVLYSQLWHI